MLNISRSINSALSGFRSHLFSLLAPDLSLPNLDQSLNSAFQLAYFICPDKDIASSITAAALSQINSSLAVQYKRRSYSPTGFLRSDGCSKLKLRTKVLMTRLQLFQSLIYTQSQPFEIKHEQACSTASLDEDDLIIRFIKHLVAITASRNSFYVTVGISRLLHSYTTAEAMSIYNVVIQDPDRIKDDAYYRFCKSELMRELIKRFGNYINKIRCARGEERFESDNKDRQPVELVRRCLKLFTPWDTSCVAMEDFDPNKNELSALVFKGENPDQEHPIEMRRMHSIIHPGCYSRITGALRYDLPDERLSMPRFNLAEGRSNGMRKRADRFNPPELSEERKKSILEEVAEQEARRKRVRPRELKIMVDWEEVAILELSGESSVKFEVDKWAGMIKVCAEDEKGELVIGIYRLEWYEEVEEGLIEECEMELEGGERLKFVLRMRRGRFGEYDGAEVEIGSGKSKVIEEAREYLSEVREGREAIKRKGKEEKEVSYSRLHRRYAFGEMSIDVIADNRNFISFSSESVLSDRLRISLARFYQDSSLRIITKQSLLERGGRLVSLAEDARFLRQRDVLEEISERLTILPLSSFQGIGSYYKAFCHKWEGQTEEARALFEKVSEKGSFSYRAKAIQSLGVTYLDKGDYDSAHRLLTEASRLACRNEYANPIAFLQSQWWLGILQSMDGDHESSLARFDGLRPLVELVASRHLSLWFEYQNSLAVELMEMGRMEEAEHASRIALASPFARVYPEWHEMARDIAAKARRASPSFVAISSLPSHAARVASGNLDQTSEIDPQPSAGKLAVISSGLPAPIASSRRMRNLLPDEKLSHLAKLVRDLGLCDETQDSIEECEAPCSSRSNKKEKPGLIDIESQSDLERIINLWANHEITPEEFAAVMLTLADCKDYFRFEEVSLRMVRYTFFESDDCTRSEREWRRKVAREIDLESLDLEKVIRLWFMGNITPDQLGSIIVQLDDCPDSDKRSLILDRLVHYAFLEATRSKAMSEDEWRRKMKARVKPIVGATA